MDSSRYSYLLSGMLWPNHCLGSHRLVKVPWDMFHFSGHVREDIAHFKSQNHLFSVWFKWPLPGNQNECVFVQSQRLASVPFLPLPSLCILPQGADSAGFVSQAPRTAGCRPRQAPGRYWELLGVQAEGEATPLHAALPAAAAAPPWLTFPLNTCCVSLASSRWPDLWAHCAPSGPNPQRC